MLIPQINHCLSPPENPAPDPVILTTSLSFFPIIPPLEVWLPLLAYFFAGSPPVSFATSAAFVVTAFPPPFLSST